MEGFRFVLVEDMAVEKPVIASMVGEIPAIVEDGVTGIFVDPRGCSIPSQTNYLVASRSSTSA